MKSPWRIGRIGIAGSVGLLVAAGVLAPLTAAAEADPALAGRSDGVRPAESPSATCYKYTYPKDKACGSMSGKSECASEPSVDEDDCKVEKGGECTCADEDDDDDDDD
jgi:hypothetical protein